MEKFLDNKQNQAKKKKNKENLNNPKSNKNATESAVKSSHKENAKPKGFTHHFCQLFNNQCKNVQNLLRGWRMRAHSPAHSRRLSWPAHKRKLTDQDTVMKGKQANLSHDMDGKV